MKDSFEAIASLVDGKTIDKIVINKTTVSIKFTAEPRSIVYNNHPSVVKSILELDEVYRLEQEIEEAKQKLKDLQEKRKKMAEEA